MTNEELNTALYKKVFAEQEKYREWLLSQPARRNPEPLLRVHGTGGHRAGTGGIRLVR